MAAKKKHHSKTRRRHPGGTKHRRVTGKKTIRRRRRVGKHEALTDAIVMGVGLVGGAVLTPFVIQGVNTALGAAAASMPAWMVPGGALATGAVVAGVSLNHKNHFFTGLGAGMAAIGAVMVANEAGLNEPGIAGTAFSNNAAPGSSAVTTSIGCRRSVGQAHLSNSVGNMSSMEAQAIGALYSN